MRVVLWFSFCQEWEEAYLPQCQTIPLTTEFKLCNRGNNKQLVLTSVKEFVCGVSLSSCQGNMPESGRDQTSFLQHFSWRLLGFEDRKTCEWCTKRTAQGASPLGPGGSSGGNRNNQGKSKNTQTRTLLPLNRRGRHCDESRSIPGMSWSVLMP